MIVKRTSYIVKRIKHPVYNYKRYWLDSYWLFGVIPIYIKQNGVQYSMVSKG